MIETFTEPTTRTRPLKPSSLRYYQDGPPYDVDLSTWRLGLTGLGLTGRSLSYGELLALPRVEEDRRYVCVCNWSMRERWSGFLLSDLLAVAGWDSVTDGRFLKQTSVGTVEKGCYESTVPLGDALSRRALIVDRVDGMPLPVERGYPLRFFDFGLYGYKSVKGLARLELTNRFELGEWERRAGYTLSGEIRPKRYRMCDLGRPHQPVTRFNHPRWEARYRATLSGMLTDRMAAPWWEGACLAFVRGFSSNQDWMISRQNWWGILVPAWHCAACGTTIVTTSSTPPRCEACGQALTASEDVLDVLFHSALWATCVTTDSSRDYQADLAVIGHDILEFWIPTANLLSSPLFGAVSIRDVLVHGVITDEAGRKMSKSAGNAASLADLLAQYGMEAVRSLMLSLAKVATAEESVQLAPDDVARAAAWVGWLRSWCGSVVVSLEADRELDRRLTDAHAGVEAAFTELDVGDAYRYVTELTEHLPARVSPAQRGEIAAILAPFHPELAAMVGGGGRP